jgi:hypothetical protein
MATERPLDEVPGSAGTAVTTPAERADEIFLEGPPSRFAEFFTLLRVMRDFLRGFRTLHFVGPCGRSLARPALSATIPITNWPEKWARPLRGSDSRS